MCSTNFSFESRRSLQSPARGGNPPPWSLAQLETLDDLRLGNCLSSNRESTCEMEKPLNFHRSPFAYTL